MTFMFGLQGLLLFAIPNALGLMLFGLLTQIVARRHAGGQESLALFFDKFAKPFRLIFYLYQVLALTLTVFALTKYLFRPLELVSGPLTGLYLCMVVFVVLAAGCLFGEEFGIQRIKFGHGLLGVLLLACVAVVLFSLQPLVPGESPLGRGVARAHGKGRICSVMRFRCWWACWSGRGWISSIGSGRSRSTGKTPRSAPVIFSAG